MSSATPAGTASAQPSNNSGVANPESSESNYNMNATPVEPARTADDNWAQVQNEMSVIAGRLMRCRCASSAVRMG